MPTEREKQGTVAIIVGIVAAVLWYLLILATFSRPDGQGAFAVCFGPFYSLWFGMSVNFIALGIQRICTENSEQKSSDVVPWILLLTGVLGALLMLFFLMSEHYQMTHPGRLSLPR